MVGCTYWCKPVYVPYLTSYYIMVDRCNNEEKLEEFIFKAMGRLVVCERIKEKPLMFCPKVN